MPAPTRASGVSLPRGHKTPLCTTSRRGTIALVLDEVIGRAAELEAIEAFLDALDRGPAALVLEGEPGIGKTTLMRAGVATARARGARVLSCTASASETRLSYVALADLLADVDGDAVAHLPPPQRDALDAALLRADPRLADADWRAVATAARSVLARLAEDATVVVAIDDVQWLDRPSARVVEFCARRLAGPVGMIASRRTGEDAGASANVVRLAEPERMDVRRLAPFDADALRRLLRARAPQPLDRRSLERLHEASGGNPFYALELARALPEDGSSSPALPLPTSLREIVDARMVGLDHDAEEILLAVAALADPAVEVLELVLGRDVGGLLDVAEERGLIERAGRRVRFTHPLLANGVYAHAPPSRRRALHRQLSTVVSDVEDRARHLAHADAGPEALAALDEAAAYTRARGAPAAAAELLELALGLGGGPELRLRAAEHHFDAGDPARARALLEEAVGALPSGEARARALTLLAEIRYHDDSYPEGRALLEQAQREPGVGGRLRVMIELRLTFVLFSLGRTADAGACAHSALVDGERLGDPALLAQALAVSVMVDFCLGLGLDEQRLTRALAFELPDLRTTGEFHPALIAGCLFTWTGRLDEARALLDELCAWYAERGEEHALAWGYSRLVWVECLAGDLGRARRLAEQAVEPLARIDTRIGRALDLASRAAVEANAGHADAARTSGEKALALFADADWQWESIWATSSLGMLELSLGDAEAAVARLAPASLGAVSSGLGDPAIGGALIYGDAAEALVAVGRIADAERIADWLEERGAALERPWAIAVGARCRGLILAARGDVGAAEAALERSLVAHARLPMPLEHARSLLVLGRIRRRRRRRLAAKDALEQALAIFDAVGSPLWARQARAELAAIGLRRGSGEELTPSEERVARLAASGLTNREVAATLIVSPKTVEAQLARAYRKLGIRSRAQLGARMAPAPTAEPAEP
jgi:DNA-binding CsgD family transcriptional regulator